MERFTKISLFRRERPCYGFFTTVLAVILTLSCTTLTAQSARRLNVTLQEAPLQQLFDLIRRETGFVVNYVKEEVDADTRISVDVKNVSLRELLAQALQTTGYVTEIDGNIILVKRQQQQTARQTSGTLYGQVLDSQSGDPVIGATIKAGNTGTTTDVKGEYRLRLPAGTYTISISSIGYASKQVRSVEIKRDALFQLGITLAVQKGTLKGVEVVASARSESIAALYTRQKNNVAISDGISAEQIRRTPDNNVAQVLKRVSGLTVQDNKFVTVRGMSERYNNMLLNGSSLPSTEPNRRNFAFDIIPSNLIDNVVVNKTATPDLPGEFTGGLVQVNTIDVPKENFLQVSAGTGWNSISTGKDFYSTRRMNSDYAGTAGDGRRWFRHGWDAGTYQQYINDADFTSAAAMNAKVPNNYGLYQYTAKPMQQYQLSLGRSKQFNAGNTLGLVLAGSYRHEENIEEYDAWFRQSPTIVNGAREYNFITAMGAIGNLAYQAKNHKISWRNVLNRRFSHVNIDQLAEDKGMTGMHREYISMVESSDLLQSRLEGEHVLGARGIRLRWFGDMASVEREQPDTRYSSGLIEGYDSLTGKELLKYNYIRTASSTIKDGGLFASWMKEKRKNAGLDFTYPFTFLDRTQKIKTGYWGTFRDADYEQVSLAPMLNTTLYGNAEGDKYGYGKPDYMIFTPENFASGLFYYQPVTVTGLSAGDYYKGKQSLHAAYIMADLQPLEKLRVIGGVRMEDNTMDVTSVVRLTQGGVRNVDSTVRYRETEWLPSVNIIYSFSPKVNIRAAYSKTLARPDFRERASYIYYDFRMRQSVKGVTGLKASVANNADLRFEWYPHPAEVLSITGFYKKYDNPVELVSYKQSDNKYNLFYFNLVNAENIGFELDYRRSFGFIRPSSKLLNNLYLSANFAYMKSTVTYDAVNIQRVQSGLEPLPPSDSSKSDRKRPLQGLSPYIINAGLSYQGSVIGMNITYNRFGRRVLFAGIDDYDDTYENPRDLLDLQVSARLLKQRMELRMNISDLLNQYYVEYFNKRPDTRPPTDTAPADNADDPKGFGYNAATDWRHKQTRKGTNYSFTVSYRF
ncbi:TonB-dependent receptor [Chitinophaga sp. XS-30]|uniref:TonB-dependent receptor n=1 Tax=Chitinophaga sp. XS-30 TaxID=2604421 RepID=UPI0011DD1497|nr:TonB-dependent receptor [Chitinophaga sp. XS-30]QEH43637.1 TonB-dependent receptor plug domain-containing protein [Chitinophaga sp. XS-30]